jgi:hypothetical protein
MKVITIKGAIAGLFVIFTSAACTSAAMRVNGPQYLSPVRNAKYVSTGATIVVRYGPDLSESTASNLTFNVNGSRSGVHDGQTILADDHKTVIFKPKDAFTPGERVQVDISGVQADSGTRFQSLSYTFDVASNQQPGSIPSGPPPANPPRSAFPGFLTVPQDIPHFTISGTAPDAAEGDILVAPFYWTGSTVGSYLLILTQRGQLVYFQSMANALAGFDFKVQPNGMLSYFDQRDSTFYVMDTHYKVVDSYKAGDGYTADLHDLQLLPNGDALLMIYDSETLDMSQVVPGGQQKATVTGLIIQEQDPSKNVIFEWRSWDHFSFFDSTAVLTGQQIDLVHGNALAPSNDGNLLLSSRNLSEITKINLQTGAVMWRLGGKANMFRFINGQPFAFQHDVRQLPNGDITVFDNQGTTQNPAPSQGIEYRIDEVSKTATVVWNFSHAPDVFTTFMGNTQRVPSGNTLLSWGAPFTHSGYSYFSMTEVTPENQAIFDFTFDQPYVSYRAFLFPWHGFPETPPALAAKGDASGLTLGYSWNGATEVASYRVYGGSSPTSLTLIDQKTNTDFENQSHLSGLPQGECYFQVAALDKDGNEMARSKVITTDGVNCPLY